MDFDWKVVTRKLAPLIGGALGGPLGGAALSTLSNVLLGKPDGTEAEVEQAMLIATPEQLAAIKQANNEFKIKMAELGLKEKDLILKDRNAARDLFKVNIWPQIVLSTVFISGYFFVISLLISGQLKVDEKQLVLVTTVLGVLTASMQSIMQFWFGSSSGSKEKTNKMQFAQQ